MKFKKVPDHVKKQFKEAFKISKEELEELKKSRLTNMKVCKCKCHEKRRLN